MALMKRLDTTRIKNATAAEVAAESALATPSLQGAMSPADKIKVNYTIHFLGDWSNSVNYFANDLVIYNGFAYICTSDIAAGDNLPVENTSHWTVFSTNNFDSQDIYTTGRGVFGGLIISNSNGDAVCSIDATGAVNCSTNITAIAFNGSGANLLGIVNACIASGAAIDGSKLSLSSGTGLPISTGVSGLATGVATFLGTPSSANLRAALTDETGTGAAVFANSPTLIAPALGTPVSGDLGSCTNIPAPNLSGIVGDAHLSSNVPLKNAANTITGNNQTFGASGAINTSRRVVIQSNDVSEPDAFRIISNNLSAYTDFGYASFRTNAGNYTIGTDGGSSYMLFANGRISYYAMTPCAGWGVPAIYGSGRSVAQTTAVSSVAAYTCGGNDSSFEINANGLVTAYTSGAIVIQVTYTDESNTFRTFTLPVTNTSGTTGTSVGATGPFSTACQRIRAKAGTDIKIITSGTFAATYNVEGSIKQIA